MIVLDANAPQWAHEVFRRVDEIIKEARQGLFVSLTVYDATGDLPDPATNVNKLILLSGGTFWLAKSDGSNWVYPDETNV